MCAWAAWAACAAPAARPPQAIANASSVADGATGPFTPRPPAGPYRSIADWCSDLARRSNDVARAEWEKEAGDDANVDGYVYESDPSLGCVAAYAPMVTSGPTRVGPSGGAITAAELVPMHGGNGKGWSTGCALVLHTGDRLWAAEDVMPCLPSPDEEGSVYQTIAVDELAWDDRIDRAPHGEAVGKELVLTVSSVRETGSMYIDAHEQEEIVCGVGASGTPRCTPEIPITGYMSPAVIHYQPTIDRDGTLRFRGDLHAADFEGQDAATYSRAHPLRFP